MYFLNASPAITDQNPIICAEQLFPNVAKVPGKSSVVTTSLNYYTAVSL